MNAQKAPQYPGIGARIRQRLIELGYVKLGKPDVERFVLELKYKKSLFNMWLAQTRSPKREAIDRLAHDLKVTRGWLCFGDENTHNSQEHARTVG